MGFADRAVEACRRDWMSGTVAETHVRDVLKSRRADVSCLEEFLGLEHPHEVRWAAARILSERGRISEVVRAAMLVPAEERDFLLRMLSLLGKKEAGLAALENLVASGDTMVRDAAVEMFRRAG